MVSIRRKTALKVMVLSQLLNKRGQRIWTHPLNKLRNQNGEHLKIDEMHEKYPDRFFQYTRMTPALFDKLLSIVGPHLKRQETNYRETISVRIRLYVILRYLATGDSLYTIATNYSMGQSTVWSILKEGLPIIWEQLRGYYVRCPTQEDWRKIADGYQARWNYPNCVGALDGKHVVITAPNKSGSLYLNYKGTFSIVLLASCDAEYKFTTVDVGGYGKQSDGGIFNGSQLGKKLYSGTLPLPDPMKLPLSSINIPFHFIADEAFPLSLFMMRPYPGKALNNERRIFNYRLSRARRCIENAFGIMSARFRIFRKAIAAQPKNAECIVLAAVALHNFILTEEAKLEPSDRFYCPLGFADAADEANGAWRNADPSYALADIQNLSIAAHERLSKKMRDDLRSYFNGTGALTFQNARAGIVENEQA